MNRRVGFILLMAAAAAAGANDRPNVVWITTEDNSAGWLRLYDAEHGVPMPNVERLAAHGVVFEHAFSNGAVCSVARSTLLSGCYAPRVGTLFHRKAYPAPMPEGLLTYPEYFRKAGYYTANCRKTDYNFAVGDVWDACSNEASYRNRKPGQPFFQVWSLHQTHEGQMHKALDQRDPATLITRPEQVQLYPCHPDTPLFRKSYAHYYDKHRDDDVRIGQLISQLEADGVMDDTVIFYYGDHGGTLPRSKGYAYESGLHVPLVVYIPDKCKHLFPVDAGSRIDGFVSFVDFAPTVLHLAGIEVPASMDGRPFLGEGITLEALNRRNETFGHADRFDEKYDFVRTLRQGRYKYMRSYPWKRYWGLIVCNTFGKEASAFTGRARELAGSDPEPLVRVRGAEFLGLTGNADAVPLLEETLAGCRNGQELLIALNSAALLKTLKPELEINLASLKMPDDDNASREWLERRIDFLESRGLK